jgi:CRISPR-associated protein Cas1
METLFIDRKGSQLSTDHGRLKIYLDGKKQTSLPLHQLRSIIISCDCQLTSSMLRTLAKLNISLICLNNRDHEASFIGTNENTGNIHRKIHQYRLLNENEYKHRIARLLIKQKIRSQQLALTEFMDARQDLASHFKRTKGMLMGLRRNLEKHSLSELTLSTILGIEGTATRQYFDAYKRLFPESLNFTQRNKRPPKDPINVLLSLSYTILHYEAKRACQSHSLEPNIGILHQPSYNRASLACDLTELLRSQVDIWVWTLTRKEILRKDHFQTSDNACLLTKTGRQHFYQALAEELPVWREQLRRHAGNLANHFDSQGE